MDVSDMTVAGKAEVEATVLDILGETLEETTDALRSNRVLAAHEWDSITSLLTLAQLESHFRISLDLRSYHAARTVDDLVSLVLSLDPEGARSEGAPR